MAVAVHIGLHIQITVKVWVAMPPVVLVHQDSKLGLQLLALQTVAAAAVVVPLIIQLVLVVLVELSHSPIPQLLLLQLLSLLYCFWRLSYV